MPETVYTKRNGHVYYPKRIPRQRQNTTEIILLPLLLGCFIAGAINFNATLTEIIFLLALMILTLAFVEILLRLRMLYDEYFCLESRYNGNLKELFHTVYVPNEAVYVPVVVILSCFIIIILLWRPIPNEYCCMLFLLMILYIIQPFLNFKNCSIYKSKELTNIENGLDIGTAMAISFFHGYLKIVLPASGTNDRGIIHLMDIYEAREHIKFVNKALYILIPLSLHCPVLVVDSSKIMEEAASLDAIEEDVAGVRNRNYKNSIYKIKFDDAYYYVAVEFASPLRTFNNVIKSNRKCRAYYEKFKKDILWKFYTTLNELVNEDPEVVGLVEFVYYDDLDDEGKPVDVGNVLLKKLVRDRTRTRPSQ